MIDYSLFWIGAYILCWILTLIYYQSKRKIFDAGSLILLLQLIYAILSFFLYEDQYWGWCFLPIKPFPFIYLYLTIILTSLPIFKYDLRKIDSIQRPSNLFFNIVAIIFIIGSIWSFPSKVSMISSGFIQLLNDAATASDMHRDSVDASLALMDNKVSNLGDIISNIFSNIGILFFMYYLTLKKKNLFILYGLGISIIISILVYVALGQRGGIIHRLFTLLITYFMLKKFYDDKTRKLIKLLAIISAIIIAIPFLLITVGRFSDAGEGGTISSLLYYSGQQNLYFNNFGLDDGGIRYGDRTFALFKQILGFDNVPNNFMELRQKYPYLHINDEVFYTYIGDFTIDFGPVWALLIFIVFTLFMLFITDVKGRQITFSQLIALHLVMCICVQGGLQLFPFSYTGNLKLILTVMLCIFFSIDRKIINNHVRLS